jgi:non-heme chloroperoxidase
MAFLRLRDGTKLYYKDYSVAHVLVGEPDSTSPEHALGSGKPILFSHGWPLSADM